MQNIKIKKQKTYLEEETPSLGWESRKEEDEVEV